MRIVKGLALLIISLCLLVLDYYYLLYEPLMGGPDFIPSSNQYWAISIPIALGIFFVLGTSAYIGFTMIRTKEPKRMGYEEAYELALDAEKEAS